MRRKFRAIAKAAPIEFEALTDISPYVDEIYPLYLQVHERSALKFERLTKAYFRRLGERMPDKARFFLWRQEGRIIAFSLAIVARGYYLRRLPLGLITGSRSTFTFTSIRCATSSVGHQEGSNATAAVR